jgi:hypothetical protein
MSLQAVEAQDEAICMQMAEDALLDDTSQAEGTSRVKGGMSLPEVTNTNPSGFRATKIGCISATLGALVAIIVTRSPRQTVIREFDRGSPSPPIDTSTKSAPDRRLEYSITIESTTVIRPLFVEPSVFSHKIRLVINPPDKSSEEQLLIKAQKTNHREIPSSLSSFAELYYSRKARKNEERLLARALVMRETALESMPMRALDIHKMAFGVRCAEVVINLEDTAKAYRPNMRRLYLYRCQRLTSVLLILEILVRVKELAGVMFSGPAGR